MNLPRTSVVICTHQMEHSLPHAVQSVFRQTTTDWELLILDDASSDGTSDYLKSLADSPKIRCFENSKRMGVARARNQLLHEARGEFISVLDADDSFLPEKVERHAEVLTADSRVGVVWGRALVEYADGTSDLIPGKSYVPGWDLVTPYRVVHSATTWRRASVISLGGYDESLYCEEAPDLFLKVGDNFTQSFDDGLAAYKKAASGSDFRIYWQENERTISGMLLLKTLNRRYGLSAGALVEKVLRQIKPIGLC